MTIIEFLEARLAEDEVMAEAASSRTAEWRSDGQGVRGGGEPYTVDWDDGPNYVEYAHDHTIVYNEGWPLAAEAHHIARHDPAQVLREVAAKQAMIVQFVDQSCMSCSSSTGGDDIGDCVARLLAAMYSDHPDFNPEWGIA